MKSNSLLIYIASSDVRKSVVYRLLEEPFSLTELKECFHVTSSAIVPRLKELERKNIVYKVDNKYHLTATGIILAKKLQQTDNLSCLIEEHGPFFNGHDLTLFPEHLLNRIGELGNCKLIKNDLENINATFREVLDHIFTSNSLMGISPIFDPSFHQIVLSVAQRGIPISIILTGNIFKIIENDYADALQAYLKYDNARLYVIDDAKLAFTVTDMFTSISLHHKSGDFDMLTNLMSFEESALKWGEELFEYYRQRAKEIKSR